MARASKTMLSKSGKSGHPCLVPDLSGNALKCSIYTIMSSANREALKTSTSYPFVRDTYIYNGNLHL